MKTFEFLFNLKKMRKRIDEGLKTSCFNFYFSLKHGEHSNVNENHLLIMTKTLREEDTQ